MANPRNYFFSRPPSILVLMTARHRLKIPERRGPRKQPWLRGPQKRTAVSFSWLWRLFSASVTCVCRHPDCFQLLYPLKSWQNRPESACLHRYREPPHGFPFGKPFPTPSFMAISNLALSLSSCQQLISKSFNYNWIEYGLSPGVRNSVIMNYHRIINERKINIVKNSATNEVCGKFLV